MKRCCALVVFWALAPAWAGDAADDKSFRALLEFIGAWEMQDGELLDPMEVDALMEMPAQPQIETARGQETSDE